MRKKFALIIVLILCMSVILFTACEKEDGVTYTINFEPNGGSDIDSMNISSDTTAIDMPDATKEGYILEGWYFDNDTFEERATVSAILSKLDETTTSITLYANWELDIELGDAKELLGDSLETVFLNTTGFNNIEDIDDDDLATLANIETQIGIEGEDLDQKYDNAQDFIYNYNILISLRNVIGLLDSVHDEYGYDIYLLDEEELEEIEEMADKFGYLGYFYNEEFDNLYTQFDSLLAYYTQFDYDENEFEMLEEYINLIDRHNYYLDMPAKRAKFIQIIEDIMDIFQEDDIRASKIAYIAQYLEEYDYTEFIYEEDGFWTPYPDALVDLLVGVIEAGQLTSDDMGLITYNLIDYFITYNIGEMNEEILEWQSLIEEDENNASDYQNRIDQAQNMIGMLEDINEEITLDMMTELSDAFLGFVYIINNNELISQIFSISSEEDAPTIAELSVFISSIKDALYEISTSYSKVVWDNFLGIIAEFETIISENDTENVYISYIKPFLFTDYNPFDIAGKVGDVLAVFDQSTLGTFLQEVPDADSGKRKLTPKMNDYLFDNLAILEAKLITAFLGDDVDFVEIQDFYDDLYDTLVAINIQDENIQDLYPIIISALYDIMQDKIVIDQARYTDLTTLSSKAYVTAIDDKLPEDDFDATIIVRFVRYQMTVSDKILALVDEMGLDGFNDEFNLAALLYISNISIDQIDAICSLIEGYDLENSNPIYTSCKLVFDILDQEIISKDQLEGMLSKYGYYFLQALEELLIDKGVNDTDVLGAITALYSSSNLLDVFSTLAVELLDQASIMGTDAIDVGTGEINYDLLIDGVADALVVIDSLYTTTQEKELFLDVLNNLLAFVKFGLLYENEEEVDAVQSGGDEGGDSYEEPPAEEQTGIDEELVNIIFDVVYELVDILGYDFIDDVQFALNEFILAGKMTALDTGEIMMVVISKTAVEIFDDGAGAFDDIKFASLVTAAGEGNKISGLLNVIIEYYDEILILEGYGYDVESYDDAFNTAYDPVMNAIQDVLGNIN